MYQIICFIKKIKKINKLIKLKKVCLFILEHMAKNSVVWAVFSVYPRNPLVRKDESVKGGMIYGGCSLDLGTKSSCK